MKKLSYIFFISTLIGLTISCNSDEKKITDSIKKYLSDYYFKKNLKVEFHEIKLLELKEKTNHGDSLINMAIKGKYLSTAAKLSGLGAKDFFNLEHEKQLYYMDLAAEDVDFLKYKKSLEKYRYNQFDTNTWKILYEVHVFEKYTITYKDGNSENVLIDDVYYLLDNEFNVIMR